MTVSGDCSTLASPLLRESISVKSENSMFNCNVSNESITELPQAGQSVATIQKKDFRKSSVECSSTTISISDQFGNGALSCSSDQCNYTASTLVNLRRHIAADHVREKSFKCEQCNYAASSASKLKRHILGVHNKEKPFKCDQCNYTASRPDHLKAHVISVHDKEKAFKCLLCSYAAK